jgi:hypothetical protein
MGRASGESAGPSGRPASAGVEAAVARITPRGRGRPILPLASVQMDGVARKTAGQHPRLSMAGRSSHARLLGSGESLVRRLAVAAVLLSR